MRSLYYLTRDFQDAPGESRAREDFRGESPGVCGPGCRGSDEPPEPIRSGSSTDSGPGRSLRDS